MKATKILIPGLAGALLASLGPRAIQAAELEIQFLGVNLEYQTWLDAANPGGVSGDIFDAGGPAGGGGAPADADDLDFMSFKVDGTTVGTRDSDIYLDTYIQDVWNIPLGGGTVDSKGNTEGFGFDVLTEPSCVTDCWGLGLDIDTVQVNYNGSEISIQGSGAATGIFAQMLPFGLVLDESKPISFSFTGTSILPDPIPNDGTYLTGFQLSGTGTITGTLVPVPAAVWLFGSGLLGLVAVARRRKNS